MLLPACFKSWIADTSVRVTEPDLVVVDPESQTVVGDSQLFQSADGHPFPKGVFQPYRLHRRFRTSSLPFGQLDFGCRGQRVNFPTSRR